MTRSTKAFSVGSPVVYREIGVEGLGGGRRRFCHAEAALPVESSGVALGSNGADETVGFPECASNALSRT